jgi:hypothetical protein
LSMSRRMRPGVFPFFQGAGSAINYVLRQRPCVQLIDHCRECNRSFCPNVLLLPHEVSCRGVVAVSVACCRHWSANSVSSGTAATETSRTTVSASSAAIVSYCKSVIREPETATRGSINSLSLELSKSGPSPPAIIIGTRTLSTISLSTVAWNQVQSPTAHPAEQGGVKRIRRPSIRPKAVIDAELHGRDGLLDVNPWHHFGDA